MHFLGHVRHRCPQFFVVFPNEFYRKFYFVARFSTRDVEAPPPFFPMRLIKMKNESLYNTDLPPRGFRTAGQRKVRIP